MGSRIWFPHDRTPRDKSGQKKIPKSFRTTFSVLEHHFPVLEHPFLLCPVLSRVPSRILAVPARPVPNFGCPGPSRPLARFLACPIVPLSRDNEGTCVPVSRKVALSHPVGNPTTIHYVIKAIWIRNWIFHFWIWQNLRKKSCRFYKLFPNCSILKFLRIATW